MNVDCIFLTCVFADRQRAVHAAGDQRERDGQHQSVSSAIFFFSMDIISPDLDSFRAAAVGVGV